VIKTAIYLTMSGASGFGIFAAEDVPGWSDISAVFKIGIIGALLFVVLFCVWKLFQSNAQQREDYLASQNQDREERKANTVAITTAFSGFQSALNDLQKNCGVVRELERHEKEK